MYPCTRLQELENGLQVRKPKGTTGFVSNWWYVCIGGPPKWWVSPWFPFITTTKSTLKKTPIKKNTTWFASFIVPLQSTKQCPLPEAGLYWVQLSSTQVSHENKGAQQLFPMCVVLSVFSGCFSKWIWAGFLLGSILSHANKSLFPPQSFGVVSATEWFTSILGVVFWGYHLAWLILRQSRIAFNLGNLQSCAVLRFFPLKPSPSIFSKVRHTFLFGVLSISPLQSKP